MRGVWTILKREVYSFFVSPMAYVVLTAWLLWCGVSFGFMANIVAAQGFDRGPQDDPLIAFFGQTTLFYLPLLVFVPLFTMRLLAAETDRGTIETLLTAPVDEISVVLGKYLAALVFWITLWLPTLLYAWLTSRYGDVDLGVLGASYLGIFGVGAYYMAVGLAMSAVARTQIVAAILTFLMLGGLFLLGLGQFVFTEHREVFVYMSIWGHMESFSRGVIDTRYLVFDSTVATLGVLAAIFVLRLRRTV